MGDRSGQPAQPGGEAQALALPAATTEGVDGRKTLGFVSDVPLQLTVEIGRTRLLVREVLQLAKGSVVELDRMAGDPADLLVNGRVVARAEVTVVDDRLAVRILEVVANHERPR